METDILLAAIAGFFAIVSPIVIQWRKTPEWSQAIRVAVPVIVSLAISIAYLVATDAMMGLNVLASFLMVYGLHQLVYGTIVKHIESLKTPPADTQHADEV